MKKIMLFIALLFCLTGCAKVYENVREQRIPPHVIEIDTLQPPDWDNKTQNYKLIK